MLPPRLVTNKCLPVELLLRDQEVADLYIQDRLTRESTHQLLRCLWTQCQHLLSSSLNESKLPNTLHIMPLTNAHEHWEPRDGQSLHIVNDETEVAAIPQNFNLTDVLLIHHTVDRSSNNCALVNFVMSLGYLWSVTWGIFHDTYNSVKAAARLTQDWWDQVIRFAAYANFFHGPYKSKTWGLQMQESNSAWLAHETVRGPGFRRAAVAQAALEGQLLDVDGDFEVWFQRAATTQTSTGSTPALKFARWGSI